MWLYMWLIVTYRYALSGTVSDKRPLELSTENCCQTAADGDMVTINSLWEVASALSDSTIADPYDLPFSHNTSVTDWRTDRQTDDKRDISSTVTYVRSAKNTRS